ncbi:MAG: aspartyl/asparaginyl beta-hydroxylase domain-containing protein [Myxococcales bacterium]
MATDIPFAPPSYTPAVPALRRVLRKGMRSGRRVLDKLGEGLAARSAYGDRPVFDAHAFPWVHPLEQHWHDMRAELERVLAFRGRIPNFQDISPDQAHLTQGHAWKTFFLHAYGYRSEVNCRRCPRTAQLVETIPGMKTAFFSILGPRTHVPAHRGPYKGLLRYHLGLVVPHPERCRLRVDQHLLQWEEGKSLMFDDTYEHEVWNDSAQDRVVLFVDVLRPLPHPWHAINQALVGAVSLSPFVQDAVQRFRAFETATD